jgi:hypothetical protein
MTQQIEIQTDNEQHAILNRKIGASTSIIVALIGLTGINLAPEHAQMIGSGIALLIPCLPSVWSAFRRR